MAPLWHQLDPEPLPPLQDVASFNFPLKSLVRPFQTLLLWQVSSHCNPACAHGRFGRKTMLQLSLMCSVVFGMLSAASVSYTMLAITRTLTGVALSGLSLIVLPLGECGGLLVVRGAPGRQWLSGTCLPGRAEMVGTGVWKSPRGQFHYRTSLLQGSQNYSLLLV